MISLSLKKHNAPLNTTVIVIAIKCGKARQLLVHQAQIPEIDWSA
jgi:hypothetical protein